jgi:hypothetical protein
MVCNTVKTVDVLQKCIAVLEMSKDNWGRGGAEIVLKYLFIRNTHHVSSIT